MRPEHVCCYSGGHASALVAIEVVRRFGPANVLLVNHDINPNTEDPDIKRFKAEVADHLGVGVTRVNHGGVSDATRIPDQFEVCVDAKAFKVGQGTELCTNRLKTAPFMTWLSSAYPDRSCVLYYGFECHEVERIDRRRRILAAAGYRSDYPLAGWQRTIHSTREIGIEPPRTYETFRHANCVGCLKAGLQHWYVVYCLRKDIWQKAKDAERVIKHSIHKGQYLEELEGRFAAMLSAGVVPTETVPPQRFWAAARRAVTASMSVTEHGEVQTSLF